MAAKNDSELWCHGSSPPARQIGPPSRPKQRGALPRHETDRQTSATQDRDTFTTHQTHTFVPESQPFCASSTMLSEKVANSDLSLGLSGVDKLLPKKSSLTAYIEEQAQQRKPRDSLASTNGQCLGLREPVVEDMASGASARRTIPQQRVSLAWEKQHLTKGGHVKHNTSWHRQEQPLRNGRTPTTIEERDRPRQSGAMVAPFQGQNYLGPTFSAADTHAPAAVLGIPPWSRFTPGVSQSLFETNKFLEMWLKLEAAIESRDRMLMNMKMEMDKAASEVKAAKTTALKEKEQVEASIVDAMESLEHRIRQTDKIKSRREGLEQISTDLSVQVAELNCLLQQLQEQQRTLEALENLENRCKSSENGENDFMDKNLQQCELKLATIETELSRSRETSERLEQLALKKMFEMKEIASSLRPKEDLEPPGCHAVDLKRPKLEPIS